MVEEFMVFCFPLPRHSAPRGAVRELAVPRLRCPGARCAAKRADRGELKQIEQSDLAAQRLLQLGVRLGHRERVRAKIEEIVVQSD